MQGTVICAPKRWAWTVAFRVSSDPEMPVGKAEIVLDPRAGAGLPAGGHGIGREHVEPFGGRVHRGGESGRAGADHDEVVDVVVLRD